MFNETCQPTIFLQGSLTDITAVKVFINGTSYSTNTYQEAVDLFFKICFVLDCKYPGPASSLWRFVQKTFNEIDILREHFSPAARALKGELSLAFNNIIDQA